jgi:hypothetical protein
MLLISCTTCVFADGAYQRTDDRKKTLVWNNDPQPGDAATWSGGRDSEGYADGPGTLTWLRTQRQFTTGSNIAGSKKVPISRYTGTMVQGKFEGAVVTVDHRKTYHATFADGQRKGRWAAGPAIAKAESVETASTPEESKKASTPTEKVAAAEKVESPAEPKVSEESEPEPPTEGPNEETKQEVSKPSKANARLARTETTSGELSADELEQSATPRKPVTKKAALAPGAVRAIEQPGQSVARKSEKPKESSEKVKKATKVAEQKPQPAGQQIESPAEGPGSAGAEKTQNPSSKPANAERSEVSQPPITEPQAVAKESPADDSIRTLTGPPSSLRTKSPTTVTAAPPAPAPSTAPASSPPTAGPKLNAVQAMDIADIEARTKGYDLGEFQLPKAEYNASEDTWSVSYVPRDKDKSGKRLNVTVQDKTGKAEVNK